MQNNTRHKHTQPKSKPVLKYDEEYIRFRIVSLVDGKFRNVLTAKLNNNLEVYTYLKSAIPQVNTIHKVRVNKHVTTGNIIGIELQVRDTFNLETYKKTPAVIKSLKGLEFDKDVFKPLVDVRFTTHWDDLIHRLATGKPVLRKLSSDVVESSPRAKSNPLREHVKKEIREAKQPRQLLTMHEIRTTSGKRKFTTTKVDGGKPNRQRNGNR